MNTLSDRGRAQEAKFALDADKAFQVRARRNRMLGQWAADLLEHPDDGDLVDSIVRIGVEGDAALQGHLQQILSGRADRPAIKDQIAACWEKARAEIAGT